MSSQLQVSGEAKIRAIQGPVVANSGVITALNGGASQYVRGDGTLADFPTSTGGGSSVSYYLNSSVSQGTIGGVAYRQLSKTPISGAGTDIAISTTGYVASYLTDANDPALLEVPAGNFNCEFYFSVNNNTGNPFVYAEVYKYDGTTFTLLGTSVGVPEYITEGTVINPYYFAVPVATSVLTVTDRIAIRIYVNVDGRTVTLHTENNHLCQVVTTFSKGLISLNNLTRQNQFFGTGTSGTDFAISSSTATHTFNLPVASATNTGKLSSTDWSTFNGKQPAGNYVTLDTTQTITAAKTFSLDILVNGLTIGRGAGSIATNTAIGSSSLPVNTTGTLNTAIGNFSLLSNTTGYGNTSVGHTALGYNTTGFFNAAIGVNTLLSNTTGTYNNALGTAALYNNTTGSYNTAIGQVAGTNNTTGSNNTYIGNGSGGGITTGSNNTIIGAFNGTAALANNIVLADGAGNVRYQWDGTNNAFTGAATFSSSVTATQLSVNTTNATGKVNIQGPNDSGLLYLFNSSANARFMFNNYFGFGIDAMIIQEFNSSNAFVRDIISFASGGNVGIGTNSPSEKLHISSSASSTEIRIENSTTSAYIRSQTDNLNFYFNGAERMRITSGGDLYLGATSGARGSTATRALFKMGSSQEYLELQAVNTSSNTGLLFSDGASGNYGLIQYNSSDEMDFYTANTRQMRITSGGNVGIGTTSPATKLDVNGTTKSTNYTTINNTASIAALTTATVLTLSTSEVGVYIIQANFGAQGNAVYGSTLIVVANAGSFRVVTNGSGANAALTLSGANVQITNALGSALDATASAILIAN